MRMSDRIAIQLTSLAILSIILGTVLFAMFKVKILYLFQMVPHHTDSYTLFYTALLSCRAIPSMCFNFLQMVGVDPDDGVAYYAIYGALRLDGLRVFGLLGGFIVDYFPLLIIVVAFITLFKLIERCGSLCNIERFSFTGSNITEEKVLEGREMLQRARARKLRQLQNVSAEKISSSFDKLEEHDLRSKSYDDGDMDRSTVDINTDDDYNDDDHIRLDNELQDYDDETFEEERSSKFQSRLDKIYEKHGRDRPISKAPSNSSFSDNIKNKLKMFGSQNTDSVL